MVSVQKKLKNTNNVLAAYTFDNGMAIGCKKSGDCVVEAVVMFQGNEDGTVDLIINRDKLKALNGRMIIHNSEEDK